MVTGDDALDWPVHKGNNPRIVNEMARAQVGWMLEQWPMSPQRTEKHLKHLYKVLNSESKSLMWDRAIKGFQNEEDENYKIEFPVSTSQYDILVMVRKGYSRTEIASMLNYRKVDAVDASLRRLRKKMNVSTNEELIQKGIEDGWLEP